MLRRCLALALAALLAPALSHATSVTAPPISFGETRPVESVYGDPSLPTAQSVWIDMIRGAKRTVDLEQFYFSHRDGEALQPILDELGRAAIRGVRIRMILDAGMAKTYPHPADSIAKLPRFELRVVDYRALAGGVQHSKFLIVDGREGWLGSQNFDWRSFSQIHELGVRMRDERLAASLGAVFAVDWAAADRDHQEVAAKVAVPEFPLRLVQAPGDTAVVWLGASPVKTNPAGIPWDLDLILKRIEQARDTVCVQVMNYGVAAHGSADSTLHHALLDAAARGVEVRVLAADWSLGGPGESALRDLAAHAHVQVRISQVPEWSGGYIPFARVEHCKYMVIGDDGWVGTSNWEPSYFLNTRNVGLTFHNARLANTLHRIFRNDWNAPTAAPFTPETKIAPRAHGTTVPAGAKLYGE